MVLAWALVKISCMGSAGVGQPGGEGWMSARQSLLARWPLGNRFPTDGRRCMQIRRAAEVLSCGYLRSSVANLFAGFSRHRATTQGFAEMRPDNHPTAHNPFISVGIPMV